MVTQHCWRCVMNEALAICAFVFLPVTAILAIILLRQPEPQHIAEE